MRYLKTYEGLINDKSTLIIDLINYLKTNKLSSIFDLSVSKINGTSGDIGSSFYLKFNNHTIFILKNRISYSLKCDGVILSESMDADQNTKDELFNILIKLYNSYTSLVKSIHHNLPIIKLSEIKDRIIEFEVIRDGEVDIISLNSLFDFYKIEFDVEKYKTLNEGFLDFFKSKDRLSDEQIVKDYIKYFSNKMLDFDVVKKSGEVFLSSFEFDAKNLKIEFGEGNPTNKPNIILDGRILKVNQHITLALQRALSDINSLNKELIKQIRLHLKDQNTNENELRERIIEFDVITSDGKIDEISLSSLMEFYGSKFNSNLISAINYAYNELGKSSINEEANFDIKHIDNRTEGSGRNTRKYYFDYDEYNYEVMFSTFDANPQFYSFGFKAKKENDDYFDFDILTNKNVFRLMQSISSIMDKFYNEKNKELSEFFIKYNITDVDTKVQDIFKGFVFSLRSKDAKKNEQRLMLYKRYLTKYGFNIYEKDTIYYITK